MGHMLQSPTWNNLAASVHVEIDLGTQLLTLEIALTNPISYTMSSDSPKLVNISMGACTR